MELRKSHIFTEFLYGNLYDPKVPGFRIYSSVKGTPSKKQPQGFYERLLCAKCEGHMNEKFENSAKKVVQKIQNQPAVRDDQALLIYDTDYTSFKLFAISLIWRAAVAQHNAFKKVLLGDHAERMRQMLLSCEPGDPHLYPCILFKLPIDAPPTFSPPESLRKKICGYRAYRSIIGGLTWVFVLSVDGDGFPPNQSLFIGRENALPVFMDSVGGKKFLEQRWSQVNP